MMYNFISTNNAVGRMKTEEKFQTPGERIRAERYSSTSGLRSQHPIKRLREDSGTSTRSVDSTDTLKHVDYVKKLTILEMQVTKLKEDNEKLKIELDFEKQEKKYSSLREDEEEKNARDRIFNQRNALYEKNADLTAELETLSETYRKFHKDMTEKNDKLLGEVGDLKNKLLTTTDELFSERRKISHETWLGAKKQSEEIEKRDIEIIKLQNANKLKETTIDNLKADLERIDGRLAQFTELQKSEFQLRMELDTLRNKEIYATVFPDKIIKSSQVQDENLRLQRDIKNLREEKENSGLLKIKLEDSENEVKSLKKQLTDFHTYKDQYDSLTAELKDWMKVKAELKLNSPHSIISTVSKLEKDSLHITSQLEKYKSEKSALVSELSELRAAHTELEHRANADSEKYAEMKKKLSYCEVKAAEYREEAASCRKLLETYQTTGEGERQHLPKQAGSKILHMRHNPYQDKLDSELKRLKEENAKLRQQVESSQNSSLIREFEHLQQQVSESEAALKKTRTIYQTKVKEFKTGIFDLFGYSVTCPADNQYSLLSVFAESQDDNILFYRVKNNLQLIETRFTKSLDLQAHIAKLTQHRSIPLFLSDVTSDLFHRQTVVGGELEYTCEFGGYSKTH
ncbi:hypothetical protein ACHWQZ_G015483 [Mnemiopsis leidyi]